jgi:hypothetical protein
MEGSKSILSLLNFGLMVLATMLFVADSKIDVPYVATILGRLHPLILHLPIGVLFAAMVTHIFSSGKQEIISISHVLYQLTATTALISVITGIILSVEPESYDVNQIWDHKLWGYVFAMLSYVYSRWQSNIKWINVALLMAMMGSLLYAGHQGATITHGKDFISYPKTQSSETAIVKEADGIAFDEAIKPILEKKCFACHNPEKTKGGLLMTDPLAFEKGGKNGLSFIKGDAKKSLMSQRMWLPLEDELHMPPNGKNQLTDQEKKLISLWINAGADFTKKWSAYPNTDSFYIEGRKLIQSAVNNGAQKTYTFAAATSKTIATLQSPYVKVKPIYDGSPALSASIFLAAHYKSDHLKSLEKIKEQLVSLNTTNIPVTDDECKILASFTNLEKLILNGTKITEKGVLQLTKLKNIEHLALERTAISKTIENIISALPQLKSLYLANTKITNTDIEHWRKKYPKMNFIIQEAEKQIALSPPILVNETTILGAHDKVIFKHQIAGTKIKYTIDGSIPDSINSIEYTQPFAIKNSSEIQAIAVKEGWIKSTPLKVQMLHKGQQPTKGQMLTEASIKYPGLGAKTFINGVRGSILNLQDTNWIAFQEGPFVAIFEYTEPKAIQQLAFCWGLQIPAYVFPPVSITVSGSHDNKTFVRLTEKKFAPFDKNDRDGVKLMTTFIDLPAKTYKYYKVESQNVSKIPQWHPGKGTPGWLFIDEIFFYE